MPVKDANKNREYVKRYSDKMSSITIRVKPEYHKILSEYAKISCVPIRQLIIRAIDEYMLNHPIDND